MLGIPQTAESLTFPEPGNKENNASGVLPPRQLRIDTVEKTGFNAFYYMRQIQRGLLYAITQNQRGSEPVDYGFAPISRHFHFILDAFPRGDSQARRPRAVDPDRLLGFARLHQY
jgi:hypothetical protein